jgi:hypothetical protein
MEVDIINAWLDERQCQFHKYLTTSCLFDCPKIFFARFRYMLCTVSEGKQLSLPKGRSRSKSLNCWNSIGICGMTKEQQAAWKHLGFFSDYIRV